MIKKTFKLIYDIHCHFENFFKKEIIIHNCMSELHAKIKLKDFVKKKYPEFDYIIIISCKEEGSSFFDDLLGNNNPFSKTKNSDYIDILKNIVNKKKK